MRLRFNECISLKVHSLCQSRKKIWPSVILSIFQSFGPSFDQPSAHLSQDPSEEQALIGQSG